jgi:fumarylacetoacetate (FAA) hydrolase family protein
VTGPRSADRRATSLPGIRPPGSATVVGRLHDPGVGGPCVVALRGEVLVDLTGHAPTTSALLDRPDAVAIARRAAPARSWAYDDVLAATLERRTDRPHLLAPIDLQVIKAAGVTFVRSMLERVVEEAAGGDQQRADDVRQRVTAVAGGGLADVVPGSAAAERLRETLRPLGLWSQYLEVGLGPDPELFTKAPVLSAVGLGAEVGVLARSTWNNPEPEAVVVASSTGRAVGATLGNDVNLRDLEGRSALLLGQAKDNNASCALGPFVRLFDDDFSLDDLRRMEITLRVDGADGFLLEEVSSMAEISRDPADLLERTCGPHHQYPDGFVLFTGTMFAPVQARPGVAGGFTHLVGDRVTISCPELGALVNTVTTAEQAPRWESGIGALMQNLAARGLLGAGIPAAADTGGRA